MNASINILLVTIDGGGNIPAVMGLARQLGEQGYRIHVLSEPCMAVAVRSYVNQAKRNVLKIKTKHPIIQN
jgi:hypothetical protein